MSQTRTLTQLKMSYTARRRVKIYALTVVIFSIAILYFSPILYMFLSAFKTEFQAVNPRLIFNPTVETLKKVLSDREILSYLGNSLFQVVFTTIICTLLALPAAFILVFGKFKKKTTNERIYVWFITTILLPPVAVITPLYIEFQHLSLNKTPVGLLIAYIGFNTPIVIWMLHSFLSDVPIEIIEAAQIDGCSRFRQLIFIVIPLVRVGIISAGLLVSIFVWNEFFLGFNLTGNSTATLPVYMARFREQQGMFVAQLSAASTIAILPAVIFGWIAQKSLVKGLTLGAVKG